MFRRHLLSFIVFSLLCVPTSVVVRAADKTSDELVSLIVKLIGESDKEFRAAGLEKVRTSAKGTAATQTFAAQLTKLDASGQIALLNALADRGDTVARGPVLALQSASKDEAVRAAALATLGRLGSAADLPLLVKSLASDSKEERNAAKRSLIQLSGDAVSKTLAADSRSAAPMVKAALIEVLATRRASEELPAFILAATDDDSQVRSAAMSAIGQLGHPEHIAAALPGVLKAQRGFERDRAERDIALICSRIDDVEKRGTTIIEALNTVSATDRDELLSLVGRVGGKTLVKYVADIATGADVARRHFGIDALGKWPDASTAETLLEIVNKATDPAERNQAFQAFVKIGAVRDNRNDKERLRRMKEAMDLAQTNEDRTLVINRTRTAYDVESLRFVLPFVDQPEFAQIACETIVEIAHHREVRDLNKDEFDKALDKVIENSKDPVVVERAQLYKQGKTWERPRGDFRRSRT